LGFLLDGQDVAAKDQDAFACLDFAQRVQAIAVGARRARFDVRVEPVELEVVQFRFLCPRRPSSRTHDALPEEMAGLIFLLRLMQSRQPEVLFPVVVPDAPCVQKTGFFPVEDIANAAVKGVVGF
jgi:hypothetical protein